MIEDAEEEDAHAVQMQALCVGISCHLIFMQANYTGPSPPGTLLPSPFHLCYDAEKLQKAGVKLMSADSEDCYHNVVKPWYCLASTAILADAEDSFTNARSVTWWGARALKAQQQQLMGNANSLFSKVTLIIPDTP